MGRKFSAVSAPFVRNEKSLMKTEIKLSIAGTIISLRSQSPLERFTQKEKKVQRLERFDNFFYHGRGKPQITVRIQIVEKLPQVNSAKNIFITRHFQDGSENWRLLSCKKGYVYKSPLETKEQVMFINNHFNRVVAYLLPSEKKGKVWQVEQIIYDFLQVLLINYFSRRNEGVFVHSIGVRDLGARGFLFAGKSGAGKSTTARIWHKHSQAMVLNDDRIIVRKQKGKFFIHGSPWHGAFSDYLSSRIESAVLEKLFFIHHAPQNCVRRIRSKEAFKLLYPSLFPPFWDKECLENTVSFCTELVNSVPCYQMGFVNDKNIIPFVREI